MSMQQTHAYSSFFSKGETDMHIPHITKRSAHYVVALAVTTVLGLGNLSAQAQTVEDNDASVDVSDDGSINDFEIGEAGNQLFEQLHFVSINGDAPERTGTFGVDEPITVSDNTWSSTISDSNVKIQFDGAVTDDGVNLATAIQDVTFTNLTQDELSLTHYFYVDYDIPEGSDGDTAVFDTGIIRQSDDGLADREMIGASTRSPDFWEIDSYSDVLDKLDSAGSKIDLADAVSEFTGDATWALQFDSTIPAGESVSYSTTLAAVPEPTSLALFGIGGLLILQRRRRHT